MLGLGLQFCNYFAFPSWTARQHFCLSYFYNSNKGQSQDSIKSKKKWSSVVQDCFFLQEHTKCQFVVCAFAKLRSYRQYWFGLPALWKQALGGGQEGWSLNAKLASISRSLREGSLLFSGCTCAGCVRACTELTGGSTVRRPRQGNQGKDAPRQPTVSSSLAAMAASPRELFPCLNLSAVKWG